MRDEAVADDQGECRAHDGDCREEPPHDGRSDVGWDRAVLPPSDHEGRRRSGEQHPQQAPTEYGSDEEQDAAEQRADEQWHWRRWVDPACRDRDLDRRAVDEQVNDAGLDLVAALGVGRG